MQPVRWPAEAIWERVAPLLPGFTVEVLPEVDSTNSELMRRARAGRTEPILLVAELQSAGRGRLGRPWFSGSTTEDSAGDALPSLTFSLGLPLAPADWSGLSLAVGVAVAESLDAHRPPMIGLKWPNDIWLSGGGQDRKLAGILVETATVAAAHAGVAALRYAVIGVGINITPRDGSGMALPPAHLSALLPGVDAPEALARIVPALVAALQGFEALGFAPFQARFEARDVLRDRAVTLSDGTSGTAHGVAENGALLVHTGHGMQAVTSSEVSVRPLSPPSF